MKRKRLPILAGIICLTLLLALVLFSSCSSASPSGGTVTVTQTATQTQTQTQTSSASPQVFKWRVQTHTSPSDLRWVDGFSTVFPKLISERTNGRIQLQMFPGGALVQQQDELTALQQGTYEMMIDSPSYLGGQVPASALEWGAPGEFMTVYDVQFIFDRGLEDIMRQAYAAFNAYYVTPLWGSMPESTAGILSKKPIPDLAAAKGILLRSPGGAGSDWFKLMGFVPTSLPMSEIYTAMSQGTIDAAWTSFAAMDAMGVTALTPYALETGAVGGVDSNIMVNADVWKTVPPDLQQAFIAACKEYKNIHTNIQYQGYIQGQAILKAKNITIEQWPAADWAQANKYAQQLWTQYDNSSDSYTRQAIKIVRDYYGYKDAGMPTTTPATTTTK